MNSLQILHYFFTYVVPISTILALVGIGIKIGQFQKSFDQLTTAVNNVQPVVTRLNSCVQEIQTILKNKYKTISLTQETLDLYGVASSPIVLRDEFRPFIQDSNLATQVENKKDKLISFLKKKKPSTGLDAQNILFELVVSDKIDKYLDTKHFKEILYKNGKTSKDYYLILAIYLFESIIPAVIEE